MVLQKSANTLKLKKIRDEIDEYNGGGFEYLEAVYDELVTFNDDTFERFINVFENVNSTVDNDIEGQQQTGFLFNKNPEVEWVLKDVVVKSYGGHSGSSAGATCRWFQCILSNE